MTSKIKRFCAAVLVSCIVAPLVPIHAHAETTAGGESVVTFASGSGSSCNCNCITEPQMRKLFEEYLSRENVNLNTTMMYNIGWSPELDVLKNFQLWADVESSNDLVDWSYYQPKSIDNQWRNNIFSDSTIRAFNVLGRKSPVFYDIQFPETATSPSFRQLYPAATAGQKAPIAPNMPQVSEDTESTVPPPSASFIPSQQDADGYALHKKRSLIIMSIYKAMGIEYFNKPVIYSSLLGEPSKQSYDLLDTPFFKQMASADIKWNNYQVMNAMGRSYLFMDNNYLEAYMVRAVNDRVISQADLTTDFMKIIERDYVPQGTNNMGTVAGGNCNKYIMINRNLGQGGVSTPSFTPDALGIVYKFMPDGSITYNPDYKAMNQEESCTLLDFCRYAYTIMYTNGKPVMSAQEKSAMYSLFGARLPNTASQSDIEGLGYLVINGVIPETITSAELNAPITNEDLLLYLSRIADKNTRLVYSFNVSSTDIAMANAGFAKTEVRNIPGQDMPENMFAEESSDTLNEYDFYIKKEAGLSSTVRQDGQTQSRAYFTLNAPNIGSEWSRQVDDLVIGGAPFMHYKLPVKAPATATYNLEGVDYFVMNSADWSDEPMYMCVPPGGGVYVYDRTVNTTDETGAERHISILKKVQPKENVPGYWEGKPGADEKKKPLPDTVSEITPFAARAGTTKLSFFVQNYLSLTFDGIALNQCLPNGTPKTFNKNGYDVTLCIKEETFDEKQGFRVECEIPSAQTKSLSRMLSRIGDDVDGYPAYLCRENGELLVSSKFLESKCGLKLTKRDSDNLLTLYSTTGSNIETTLIKDKNVAISGSTLIDFGSSVMFEPDFTDKEVFYINYKAIANQMVQTSIFISGDGTANVNIETKNVAGKPITLATDNTIKFNITESDTEKIAINMIPSPISSTLVLRRIGSMQEEPVVIQLKPVVAGKREESATASSFFGNSGPINSNSVVEVPLSEFEYDPNTGMVWWDAPEESEYSASAFLSGGIPIPIYKGGGGYVVANYPYLETKEKPAGDLADYTSKFTVLSSIEDKFGLSAWKADPDFMLKKQFSGGDSGNISSINSENDYTYQLFPVGVPAYLHGVEDRRITYKELIEKAEAAGQSKNTYPVTLYLGGGFYAPVRQTTAPNDESSVPPVKALAQDDFVREVSANRAAALSAKASPVCDKAVSPEGFITVKPDQVFMPLQVVGTGFGGSNPIIYISEAEMMQVKLSGVNSKMYGDDSVFGKLASYSELVFDTVNRSDLLRELKLSGLDGFLQIVYYCCLVILPRIFILSMFSVMCLSIVSRYKVYEWFAEKVFDPIAILSFGLVRYTEIHSFFIYFSCGLGIVFLVLISRGTLDTIFFYFLDQFLSILSRIKTFYL